MEQMLLKYYCLYLSALLSKYLYSICSWVLFSFKLGIAKLAMSLPLGAITLILHICCSIADDQCIQKPKDLAEPKKGTKVHITIRDLQIIKVNDYDCTITLNFHLILQWNEPRLKYEFDDKEFLNLPKTGYGHNCLWMPNVFIFGLKSMKTHSLTDQITDFYIRKNGTENPINVNYKTFLEVVFYCPMDFSDYPFDEQKCHFLMRDFNYPKEYVSYELNTTEVLFNSSQQVSNLGYEIIADHSKHGHQHQTIYNKEEIHKYSVIGFEIILQRKISQYIIDYAIPSALLVIISWVR